MKNLVRVSVPNAAEQMWIGQAAFQRMILTSHCRLKRCEAGSERIDPTRVEAMNLILAAHHMERCPFLSAGFSQHQRAMRKVKGRQTDPSRRLHCKWSPLESAGDHQVHDEKEIVLKNKDKLLADPSHLSNDLLRSLCEGRVNGPQ